MTTIEVNDSEGRFSIKISGHSGYSKAGCDIVCSAVSVLAFTLLQESKERQKSITDFNYEIKDGYFHVHFGYQPDNSIKTVIHTVLCGLKMVAEEYPDNVRINSCPKGGEI